METATKEEVMNMSKSFGSDLAARRGDYLRIQSFAERVKIQVDNLFTSLKEREHSVATDAIAEFGQMSNSVREFSTKFALSSKYSRDKEMQNALDSLIKWMADARRDMQTLTNLMMNEYRNTG